MATLNRLRIFGIGLNIGKYQFGCMVQQARTTYVLKRKYPLFLSSFLSKSPKKLKSKHYIYQIVDILDVKKQQNLELLLTNAVEGLGERGDIVSVRPHFGRYNLLLPQLAVYATPENLEKYADLIQSRKDAPKTKFSSLYVHLTLKLLANLTLLVTVNPKEPWTLEPWHIRVAARNGKYFIPEHAIQLPEQPIVGPDLAKEGQEFAVFIKINQTEQIPVRCRLHHYGSDLDPEWPYSVGEPIFVEQAKLLSEMPRSVKPIEAPSAKKKRSKRKSKTQL